MGVDEDGKFKGRLKATGIRPTFSEDLENQGIRLPADLFDPEPFARRGN
jgi:pilus assembly protein CpaF